MNRIMNTLLFHLSTDEYVTASQLGEEMLLNEKTIRRYIKEANELLVNYGASIESKHSQGYRLIIKDNVKFSELLQNKNYAFEDRPETNEERYEYILSRLVQSDQLLDIEELLDYLCISESTLYSDIKRIRTLIADYNLKLSIKSGRGLRLLGTEFNKRLFAVNFPNPILMMTDHSDEDQQIISKVLLAVLDEYNISMSEVSINNIILHLTMAVLRIRSGNELHFKPEEADEIKRGGNLSRTVAKKICDQLAEEFKLDFSEDEQLSVAIHFFGHRVTEKFGVGNSNLVISQEIYDLVTEMLQFVYVTLKIDLRKNLPLLMNLALHMTALEVRLKYHIRLKNPLLTDIRKNYALGMMIATQAAVFIQNRYHEKLDEDELGYLALVFAVSLQNKEEKIEKKNILIVCATGKTSAELLAYQYREIFGNYLDKVLTCNINELAKQNFDHLDFVLATTPIKIAVPIPILRVKLFLSDEDERILRNQFRLSKKNPIVRYYPRELFFSKIKAKDKADTLQQLCELLRKKMKLPKEFEASLFKREEFGATDYGPIVALAHPYGLVTETTFAAVAILDQPVFWGNHDIQIVILISVGEKDTELETFYSHTSEFMLDSIKPKKLVNDPSYETLIHLLQSD